MIRICMVAYSVFTDTRIRKEARALVERGDAVDFICLGNKNNEPPTFYDGIRVIKLAMSRYQGSNMFRYLLSYARFFIMASIELTRRHLQSPYQVIQVHTMPDFMIFVALIPKMMGARVVLDVHDLMPELYQSKFGFSDRHILIRLITWAERMSIQFADRAIAVHEPHLDALLRHGNPRQKFSILLNIPDTKLLVHQAEFANRSKAQFGLIYHGTVAERHGLEIAIRAVHILRAELPELNLRIIGNGEDIDRLIGLVDELGLQGSVSIAKGWFRPEELLPEILASDAGIVPILYDEFTKYMLPGKLLEYVGLGIPVICSRTETIEAYFDDSMIQYSPPGDAVRLAENIKYLYHNLDRRKELVANANRFNRDHNWDRQRQSYYRLIDDLMSPADRSGEAQSFMSRRG